MENYNLKIELIDFLQDIKATIYENKKNLIFKLQNATSINFELFEFFISDGDITLNLDANNEYKLKDVSGCIATEKIKNKILILPNYSKSNIYFNYNKIMIGGAYLEDFHDFSSNIYFDKNSGWLQIGEENKRAKAYGCSNSIIICEYKGNIATVYIHIGLKNKII